MATKTLGPNGYSFRWKASTIKTPIIFLILIEIYIDVCSDVCISLTVTMIALYLLYQNIAEFLLGTLLVGENVSTG